MKTISIVTACYNEEENVQLLYERVRSVMAGETGYRYEHLFIDNASEDSTVSILKRIAAQDRSVKIIVNARNFGWIRSPTHGLFQATGDAVISMVADLQDPPEMIPQMLREWEKGYAMVLCIKRSSAERSLMFWLRTRYYRLAERLSSIKTIQNFTGFGLFDRRVMDIAKSFEDPYPFFRGMLAEIALPSTKLLYDQPMRHRGFTKNNWYMLYDIGVLGIINHSKVPLRLAVFAGLLGALISFAVALGYLLAKLLLWTPFAMGLGRTDFGGSFDPVLLSEPSAPNLALHVNTEALLKQEDGL